VNELLHLLTNRKLGYVWPELASPFAFVPKRCPDHVEELRAVLGLQRPNGSDYCVMHAINSVAGIAAYHQLFDPQTTYDLATYSPPKDNLRGGDLIPDRHGPPFIHRQPWEWPVCHSILVDYFDTGYVSVSLNGASMERVRFSVLNDNLYVSWPEAFGVQGAVDLSVTPWDVGGQVEIIHTPVGLPYAAVLYALRKLPATDRVLREAGLADAYVAAQSDAERMTIIYTSLAVLTRLS